MSDGDMKTTANEADAGDIGTDMNEGTFVIFDPNLKRLPNEGIQFDAHHFKPLLAHQALIEEQCGKGVTTTFEICPGMMISRPDGPDNLIKTSKGGATYSEICKSAKKFETNAQEANPRTRKELGVSPAMHGYLNELTILKERGLSPKIETPNGMQDAPIVERNAFAALPRDKKGSLKVEGFVTGTGKAEEGCKIQIGMDKSYIWVPDMRHEDAQRYEDGGYWITGTMIWTDDGAVLIDWKVEQQGELVL